MHEAAADSDLNLVAFFNFDIDALLSELVDALGLPEEQDLHVVALWVLVDEGGEGDVDAVHLLRNIDRLLARPQILNNFV